MTVINFVFLKFQYLDDQDLRYIEVMMIITLYLYLMCNTLTIHKERPPSLLEKIIEDAKLDLKNIPWMFVPNKKKSLVQLFHSLHGSIDTMFAMPMVSASRSFCYQAYLFSHFYSLSVGLLDFCSIKFLSHTLIILFLRPLSKSLFPVVLQLSWVLLGMNQFCPLVESCF